MEIKVIHFVLDSFSHYLAEDEVDDFIRRLVGQRVLLMPDDDNSMDKNCIEGYVGGLPYCHVSARKAPLLRELLQQMHARSLMVTVKSHNLDKGYKTAFCEIEPKVTLTDDFEQEHLRQYSEWKYAGKSKAMTRSHKLLQAQTEYLLIRLQEEDATMDELMPVMNRYLELVPMAFSCEDRERCTQVNILLQNSEHEAVRACNSRLVEVLDWLNHADRREANVRKWIDDLKGARACQMEAMDIDGEEMERRVENLKAFPEHLFECYQKDFPAFCGNLYYNGIPCMEQLEFMNGVAVYELVREREHASAPCEQERPHVGVLATEEAMSLWAKAQRADLADEHFKPTMGSMRRASILARIMGEKLNLSPLWEPFEELWQVENLDNSNSQAVYANYYPSVVQKVENALK